MGKSTRLNEDKNFNTISATIRRGTSKAYSVTSRIMKEIVIYERGKIVAKSKNPSSPTRVIEEIERRRETIGRKITLSY